MIPDANRSILHLAAILGILGLGFWASPAAAQLAPWQQPPGADGRDQSNAPHPNPLPEEEGISSGTASLDLPGSRPELATPDQSPTPWANEEYERDGGPFGFGRGFLPNLAYESVHDRFWVRGEFLAWWSKGFATPPLLTTSPTGTAESQAGVLGEAGTSVLFGGKELSGGFRPGERISFGTWLGNSQTWGVEASYLQLSRQTEYFNASGVSLPILARPFFNSETGQQDAQIVNYPGQQGGTFSSAVATELQVAEVLVRKNLNRQPGLEFDLVGGYRYQQLEDHLAVDDVLTFSGTQSAFPAGSVVQQSDRFDTRNVFQGGVLGVSTSLRREGWTFDTLLKVAVGQTHSRVAISANRYDDSRTDGNVAPRRPAGFAQQHRRVRQQSVLGRAGIGPDLGLRFLAAVAGDPGLRLRLLEQRGPARRSDRPEHRPAAISPPAITNAARPEFSLHTSDYWVQGLNLGLDLRF